MWAAPSPSREGAARDDRAPADAAAGGNAQGSLCVLERRLWARPRMARGGSWRRGGGAHAAHASRRGRTCRFGQQGRQEGRVDVGGQGQGAVMVSEEAGPPRASNGFSMDRKRYNLQETPIDRESARPGEARVACTGDVHAM